MKLQLLEYCAIECTNYYNLPRVLERPCPFPLKKGGAGVKLSRQMPIWVCDPSVVVSFLA